MTLKLELSQTSISVKGRQVSLFLSVVFHGNHLFILYRYKTSNYKPFLICHGWLGLGLAAPAIEASPPTKNPVISAP